MLEAKLAGEAEPPLIARSITIDASAPAGEDVPALADPVLLQGWRNLAEETADRNVFFEPWLLLPALRHLAPRTGRVQLLAISDRFDCVKAVVPLVRARPPFGRVWSVWSHTHCFDNTPLLHAEAGEAVFDALFAWLDDHGASVVVWPGLATDTAASEGLSLFAQATGRRRVVLRRTTRPLLKADSLSLDAFYDNALSRNRRRGASRRRRRLEELGRIEWRVVDAGRELDGWREAFLALEASGWKGRRGTALESRPEEKAYFAALAGQGAAEGRIVVHSLELDGRPIAMTVNFRSGSQQWAFKVAYDEALRAYAPGVLAEIEGSREVIEDASVTWVDACTDANNHLMAELWPHRRTVADVMVSVRPGARPDLLAFQGCHLVYRALRGGARRALDAVRRLGRRDW